MNDALANALGLTAETIRHLRAEERLAPELDALLAADTWLIACVTATARAPDWLLRQAEADALIPVLIADHANAQAGAVFRAQASAAAAVVAWRRGDAPHALDLLRQAARHWSTVERLPGGPPQVPPRPLATLDDTVRAERALHDVRAWAPVEDIARLAEAAAEAGTDDSATDLLTSPTKAAIEVRTWARTPTGTGPLTLILEPVPGRQPGLWRAPSAGLTRTDEPFLAAARTAWTWALTSGGLTPEASVRWRLRDPRTIRVTQVTGDSAGLAFAVALQQISSVRPRLTALDPTTSYLGSTDRDGRVLTPASTPPLLPEEVSRRLRYLITPPHWTGSGPSAAAQSPVNLKLRPAADAHRAVALGRRPVRARRARILASACAALLLVAGAVNAVVQSGHSASTQDTIATAHERSADALDLANQARTQLASDPPRAIVAAVAAYRLDPADPVVRDAVIAAAAADPRARGYLSPSAPVTHLAMSADGTLVAALLTNGKLEAWRLSPNSPPRPLRVPPVPGIVRTIGFLSATHSLITAGATLALADLTHYTTRLLGPPASTPAGVGITTLAVTPYAGTFATSSPAGIQLWTAATGASRVLSTIPATTLSLAPDAKTVLAGTSRGALRLLPASPADEASTSRQAGTASVTSPVGGTAKTGAAEVGNASTAKVTLSSPVTSVLLTSSGDAYAVTAAGDLYAFDPQLRRVPGTVPVAIGSQLTLRPSAPFRDLTESGVETTRGDPELVLAASNVALVLPDDPAQLMKDTSHLADAAVEPSLSELGGVPLASDAVGSTAAMVDMDGQIKVSAFDLGGNSRLVATDLDAGAVVAPSTAALVSGDLFVRGFVALVDPVTGQVFDVKGFVHPENIPFGRPAISPHYVLDWGNPLSSLDLWRITGHTLTPVATNLATSLPTIHGLVLDEADGLLFDAGGTEVEARDLSDPAQVISNFKLSATANCLTLDQAHHTLDACTPAGVSAIPYTRAGALAAPKTVNRTAAIGLTLAPDGAVLLLTATGGTTYLPNGFATPASAQTSTTDEDSYTLAAIQTPDVITLIGRLLNLQLYSTTTHVKLLDLNLGYSGSIATLWTSPAGQISGATDDGSLFTLPPTTPAAAATYACALLASPQAEWQDVYAPTKPVTRLLPPDGPC